MALESQSLHPCALTPATCRGITCHGVTNSPISVPIWMPNLPSFSIDVMIHHLNLAVPHYRVAWRCSQTSTICGFVQAQRVSKWDFRQNPLRRWFRHGDRGLEELWASDSVITETESWGSKCVRALQQLVRPAMSRHELAATASPSSHISTVKAKWTSRRGKEPTVSV